MVGGGLLEEKVGVGSDFEKRRKVLSDWISRKR
jgi:hypothetical protein